MNDIEEGRVSTVLAKDMTSIVSPLNFLLCVGSALLIGLILAGFYMTGPDTPKVLWQRLLYCPQLSVWLL